MLLKDFSQVIAGYTFRGAIKPDVNGKVYVFQAKNLLLGDPVTNTELLTPIIYDAKGSSGYLQKNDVLIVARGMKSGAFRSTVFLVDTQKVVASSSVLIIRITVSNVLPEYFSYYLNSNEGQDKLSQIVSGSYVGAILRKDLENMEIPLPPLQKQKILVNLYRNIREQQKIMDRENIIKNNIINSIFRKAATL